MFKHYKSRMLMKINNFVIFSYKDNEYIKIFEVAIGQMLGCVEDEGTFNNFTFMKNELWSRLIINMHLDL
jgi:hypothetical protein